MDLTFPDQTILITGAAGAIGKALARAFAQSGAKVFITDLRPPAVDAASAELAAGGVRVGGLAADVTDATQVREVVTAARQFGGSLDVLVNVAGVVGQGRIEDLSEEAWDQIFAVNCKGTFLMTREVVPLMKERGRGKIVNFSSKSGKTGSALMSHYSAAKGAIIGFTQALAHELADAGINVNCVCPGITEDTGVWSSVSAGYTQNLGLSREQVVQKFTEKIPLRRLATIGDIVAVTLFLASSAADYMTGQAINVTGGREMH